MAKRISDEAVLKSTGKSWNEWFSILNKAEARKMEHKAIAELLFKKYRLTGWWSQMVTVQYEQDIKGRVKHETASGYQISKSKTFPFASYRIFNAVLLPIKRKIWLKDSELKISKSIKNKSIRGKWINGKINIEFQFYPKDKNKTQFVVQLNKLSSAKEAEKMKKYWEKSLNNLNNYLIKNQSLK